MLSIGRRCAVCVTGFCMPFDSRDALVRFLFPDDLSAVFVQCVEHPAVRGSLIDGIYIAVEAMPEHGGWLSTFGGEDENAIAPNNWTGMAQTEYRSLPGN